MTTNANDLIKQYIQSGQLTGEEARGIIQGSGFSGVIGDGNVQNAFANDPSMNAAAINQLKSRGLIPQTITEHASNTVQNPQLPVGAEFVPQLQQENQNEILNANDYTVDPSSANIQYPGSVQTPQIDPSNAQAYTASTQDPLQASGQAQTYDAATVGNQFAEMTAAQGQVNSLATVKGQLEGLWSEFDDGQVPEWAVTNVMKAEDVLASRGLGQSSIGATAVLQAMQDSALNIAVRDASTYFQMDLTNLSNEQQASLVNTQNQQQSLLSDTAAKNAAKQFNASSVQQLQQFQSSLIAQIQSQNADRTTSISQFNSAEANKIAAQNANNEIAVESFNKQLENAVDMFNSQTQNQRDQFNSTMRAQIDQSNVTWRRNINTANTAAINAANQANVQNLFNMSQVAQNNLWQAWRDEASWLWQSSENQLNRDLNLTLAANSRQFNQSLVNDANSRRLQELAGAFAFNLL